MGRRAAVAKAMRKRILCDVPRYTPAMRLSCSDRPRDRRGAPFPPATRAGLSRPRRVCLSHPRRVGAFLVRGARLSFSPAARAHRHAPRARALSHGSCALLPYRARCMMNFNIAGPFKLVYCHICGLCSESWSVQVVSSDEFSLILELSHLSTLFIVSTLHDSMARRRCNSEL